MNAWQSKTLLGNSKFDVFTSPVAVFLFQVRLKGGAGVLEGEGNLFNYGREAPPEALPGKIHVRLLQKSGHENFQEIFSNTSGLR